MWRRRWWWTWLTASLRRERGREGKEAWMSAYYAIGDAFKGLQKNVPLLRRCSPSARSRVSPRSSSCLMLFLLLPWLALFDAFTNTHSRSRLSLSSRACRTLSFFFFSRCHSRLALLTSSVALPIYILPHLVATRALVSLLSLPSCFSTFFSPAAATQNEISNPFESLLGQCHAYNPTIRASNSQYLNFCSVLELISYLCTQGNILVSLWKWPLCFVYFLFLCIFPVFFEGLKIHLSLWHNKA